MTLHPKITIGLPVYNNAEFLRQMLDSIIDQDWQDFIVVVSDDCSTDETETICREYEARDDRIQYSRNEKNLGSLKNHQRVLDLAESEYFMFARGHEILPPTLLGCAMQVLTQQHDVVLACAPTRWVNEKGLVLEDKFLSLFDTRGCEVITRSLLALWSKCEAFYGLGKTQDFRSVRVLAPFVGTDLIMILEMSIKGCIAVLPCGDRLRRYYYSENYQDRIRRHRTDMVDNAGFFDKYFPVARLPLEILRSVWRSDIGISRKTAITFLVLVSAPIKYTISRGKAL